MLETLAMFLFALWVIGLVTGNAFSGAIHALLLGGLVAVYYHRRALSRERSIALIGTSRALVSAMGGAAPARRPTAPAKPGPGAASRSTAAA